MDLETQAAVKILHTPLSTEAAVAHFRKEARTLALLKHPNIVRVLDFDVAEDTAFLVMDYASGGTLRQRHQPGTPLAPEIVLPHVRQIAAALQYAHERKVVHRDLKPENLLLASDGTLWLSDFGLALLTQSSSSQGVASIAGTYTYMAPEQLLGKPQPASDQYALGILIYEWLSGAPPFQGTLAEISSQHLLAAPAPLCERVPTLSPSVEGVVMQALEKNPKERFARVQEFAAAFEQACQGAAFPLVVEVTPTPSLVTEDTTQASLTAPSGAVSTLSGESSPSAVGALSGPWEEEPWETGAKASVQLPSVSLEGTLNGANEPPTIRRLDGPPRGERPLLPRRWLVGILAALVILASVMAGAISVFPGILPGRSGAASSATVALTPASKHLQNTYTLTGVTGTPDASKQQVQARVLSVTTPAHSTTVAATGQTTIQATHATGSLLITNYSYSAITYYAGTSFPNTNGSGPAASITIDATITLDYNSPAAIAAHVNQAGSIGNFDANPNNFVYFNGPGPCPFTPPCDYIQNYSAFSGGRGAQTYTSVQQRDVDSAANSLESTNKPDPMQVLQGQVQQNEQWVSAPQCTPNVTSDHNAGDQANRVTVTVTFTCSGEVYDHNGAMTMAANLLTQQAASDPGSGYTLVDKIKTAATQATSGEQNTVSLTVSAEGVWAYQFSADQKQAFARLIAGKSLHEAQLRLSTETGVAQVTIQLSGGGGQVLPTDPAKITIVVQAVPGA